MNLLHWWLTPKFPEAHIKNLMSYNPPGFFSKIRNFYRTWLVHPVKRRVAKFYVWFLQNFFGLKVIGITGSTGKTTSKEMLASILKLRGNTVYSYANIDPIYNIPTTILRCRRSTKYLILEMGVEYPGEMDFYLWLAKPKIGIITNVYPTHTLNFKNEDGVFKEKSKLVKGLDSNGFAILNSENKLLQKLNGRLSADIIWFGGGSEIKASDIKYTSAFRTDFVLHLGRQVAEIRMPILGNQFVGNALAAASAASSLGIDMNTIKKGLEKFEVQAHRMNIRKLKSGAILIDDTYNNNPAAARKAIDLLKEVAGKRKTILVFGDMFELGKREIWYHKEMGEYIKKVGISRTIGVGKLSRYIPGTHVDNWEKAIPLVKSSLDKNQVIMVKGSRSMNLDKLVENLY